MPTIEERLPPACTFARSVLAEHDLDPEAVPEEAVEAAQQHMMTCALCSQSVTPTTPTGTPRKKKKGRRSASSAPTAPAAPEYIPSSPPAADTAQIQPGQLRPEPQVVPSVSRQLVPVPTDEAESEFTIVTTDMDHGHPEDGTIDCLQCRQLLPEYAEALDNGQDVATLYPDVRDHLLTCESGCLVLLDVFRQDAKATRKYRRRPIRTPFGVIGWELTGFFRGGQITTSPMALAYGTLILLLLVATLGGYLGFTANERLFHPSHPPAHQIPTPDGIGLSDGLKIYDACNSAGYQEKRDAIQAMQQHDFTKAEHLLTAAMNAVQTDTTGCNGAEAAIYREDLQARQSGRPYGVVVVSFDSGPGNADPSGGTDRHILYAAYTQELVGAFIAQQLYNQRQMQTPGAPLLYLVLANTGGQETGALQIANTVASLAGHSGYQKNGLLAQDTNPLLGVLGLGPSNFVQVVLPSMCRAGIPLLSPTATGRFIIDLINQTSLYQHCAPGFSFIRFSPDDLEQSTLGAKYAYNQLKVRTAAIFYDPSNPSSKGSAQGFITTFSGLHDAHITAYETVVASGLLDADGRPQASREDLLAELHDALQTSKRPQLIFAPLLTNDVTTLVQAIARLPQAQQPMLMIGGEFVQPGAIQNLVQWARQNQLTLPKISLVVSSAARPTTNGDWQKQFYASFCTSFARPGSYCSGAAALDQGALLFGDGIEMIARGIGSIQASTNLPSRPQLVQKISTESFAGVSCPIRVHLHDNMLITSLVADPIVLGLQDDGTIQIIG